MNELLDSVFRIEQDESQTPQGCHAIFIFSFFCWCSLIMVFINFIHKFFVRKECVDVF
jgi:hypothetical protein